ncbi:hypothetical protein G7068_13620 [Leucobacter viscericola]|uniref:Uncharacterized protein n=1 Tax=Leucobacter viscericola TaxID=2714935 RepID=A0A6G7XIB5_9MICO|nr:hypothetical protein [Leucobacter viscericola]QIK64117.1 hypothetical protein G7068_13620 [Leucobacter viscericola]
MSEMSIEPNSEQVNAEDFIGGPQVVTITGRKRGTTKQPVFFELAEFPGRTYRPGKTMRRLMVAAWGPNPEAYTGRQMRLYADPEVRFGKSKVGGIRISHMSHIDKAVDPILAVARGKRAQFIVQPLATTPAVNAAQAAKWIDSAESMDKLQRVWQRIQQEGLANDPGLIEAKNERKAWLSTPTAEEPTQEK